MPGASGSSTDADVVVIGAGLSGLACARRLAARGASVLVLEARDRVGGRTLNSEIGAGEVTELGGQWAGPEHTHVRRLAEEVGVGTFPTHVAGEHLYRRGGRISRYLGDWPWRHPAGFADLRLAAARLDRMARSVDPRSPASGGRAPEWDSETLEAWIGRRMHTRSGRDLMRLSVEAVLAVDANEISLLHWLFNIRAGGGLEALIRTEGGYQQDRFAGGSQEISIRVAAELAERVRLASPVRLVEHHADRVRVVTDSGRVDAEYAVLAIPPLLYPAIEFDPPLAGARMQLAQRMFAGSVTKIAAVYDEPFWRAAGLSGHATSTEGPIKVVFDNSPPGGTPGVLVAFALGGEARRLAERPVAERADAVRGVLGELFGPRAARPGQLIERNWADEPWTRGCYAGYFGPGGWSQFGHLLRRPEGRLHWAGSETATVTHGSMNGAVSAGERAAEEVLARLGEGAGVVAAGQLESVA